jgi:hypothetical protein
MIWGVLGSAGAAAEPWLEGRDLQTPSEIEAGNTVGDGFVLKGVAGSGSTNLSAKRQPKRKGAPFGRLFAILESWNVSGQARERRHSE